MADINKYALELQIQFDQSIIGQAIDDISVQFVELENQINEDIVAAFNKVLGVATNVKDQLSGIYDISADISKSITSFELDKSLVNAVKLNDAFKNIARETKTVDATLSGYGIPPSVFNTLKVLQAEFGYTSEIMKLSTDEFQKSVNKIGVDKLNVQLKEVVESFMHLDTKAQMHLTNFAKQYLNSVSLIKSEGIALDANQKKLAQIANTIIFKNKHHDNELKAVKDEYGHILLLFGGMNKVDMAVINTVEDMKKLYGQTARVVETLKRFDAPDDFYEANYRMIGGMYDLQSAMEIASGQYNVNTRLVTEATKALASNGVMTAKNALESIELAGTMSQLNRTTGLSVSTQAEFARTLKSVGMNLNETKNMLAIGQEAMRTLGLSTEDVRSHVESLNSIITEMGVRLGKHGVEQANRLSLALIQTARDIGVSSRDIGKLVKDLIEPMGQLSMRFGLSTADNYTDKLKKVRDQLVPLIDGMGDLGERIKNNGIIEDAEAQILKNQAESLGLNEQQFKALYIQANKSNDELNKLSQSMRDMEEAAKANARVNDLYGESLENFTRQAEGVYNEVKAMLLPVIYTFMHLLTAALYVLRAFTYTLSLGVSIITSFGSAIGSNLGSIKDIVNYLSSISWIRALIDGFRELNKSVSEWTSSLFKNKEELSLLGQVVWVVASGLKIITQVAMAAFGAFILFATSGNLLLSIFRNLNISTGWIGSLLNRIPTLTTLWSRLTSLFTGSGLGWTNTFNSIRISIMTMFTTISNVLMRVADFIGRVALRLAPAVPVLFAVGAAMLGIGAGVYLFASSLSLFAANADMAWKAGVGLVVFLGSLVGMAYLAAGTAPILAAIGLAVLGIGAGAFLMGAGLNLASNGLATFLKYFTAESASNFMVAAAAIGIISISILALAAAAYFGAPSIGFLGLSLGVMSAALFVASLAMSYMADGITKMAAGARDLASSLTMNVGTRLLAFSAAISAAWNTAFGIRGLAELFPKLGSGLREISTSVESMSDGSKLVAFVSNIKSLGGDLSSSADSIQSSTTKLKTSLDGINQAIQDSAISSNAIATLNTDLNLLASTVVDSGTELMTGATIINSAGELLSAGSLLILTGLEHLNNAALVLIGTAGLLSESVPGFLNSVNQLQGVANNIYFLGGLMIPGGLLLLYASGLYYAGSMRLADASVVLAQATSSLSESSGKLVSLSSDILSSSNSLYASGLILGVASGVLVGGLSGLTSIGLILVGVSTAMAFGAVMFSGVSGVIGRAIGSLSSASNELSASSANFVSAGDDLKLGVENLSAAADPLDTMLNKLVNLSIVDKLASFAGKISDPVSLISKAFLELSNSISYYVSAMLQMGESESAISGVISKQQDQLETLANNVVKANTSFSSPVAGGGEGNTMAQPLSPVARNKVVMGGRTAAQQVINIPKMEPVDFTTVNKNLTDILEVLQELLPDIARKNTNSLGRWVQ